jgi:hypothetical protein
MSGVGISNKINNNTNVGPGVHTGKLTLFEDNNYE